MLKLLIVVLYIGIVGIISIPQYAYVSIIGKKDPVKKLETSQKLIRRYLMGIIKLLNVKVVATGIENVPKDEAVLFVSNHRGFFDIVAAYVTLPIRTGFVSKKEIKKIPCIGTWMKYLDCLFLDRGNRKSNVKLVLNAVENLKSGQSMFIMPEGTRSKTEDMQPFKKGSFRIAERAGVKVVPVGILNADEVFEKHPVQTD
jgi:1-acyl-sn-glycerol-3-phosphate acyltransferase